MAKLHLNPLKLSHYPNIIPDFVGDAVQEALEQRDAALEKIERLQAMLREAVEENCWHRMQLPDDADLVERSLRFKMQQWKSAAQAAGE